MKQLHRITGIVVSVFAIVHLGNHAMAWFGIETHQLVLDTLRKVYRKPYVELPLILCFVFQAYSGLRLFLALRKKAQKTPLERLKMYSGLAIGLFLLQHIPATLGMRWLYGFDTNFYFAARVVCEAPYLFYFVPYYFLGVLAFGMHIASIHHQKIEPIVGARKATTQMYAIIAFFVIWALLILFVLMGGKFSFHIPSVYQV